MNETSEQPPAPQAQPVPPPPPPASWAPPAPPLPSVPRTAPFPGFKKPVVAGFLSALPGVGHLYLGLYQRAAAFFAIWVVIIAIVDRGHNCGPLGILIPFWWFFVVIDAVRQAHAMNATGAPDSNLVISEKPVPLQGSLALGVFLILIGGFFLLDRFVTIDLTFLIDWWPAAVIVFGAWQVFSYYREKQRAEERKAVGPAETNS